MQKLCVFHLAAKTGNAQIAERISEQMQIETFAVFTLGQAASLVALNSGSAIVQA